MNAKVVAIIQARMGSSRLPGKVLEEIAGKPMLQWVLERARSARKVDQVVLATTVEPSDDRVAVFAERQGIAVFRGSLDDVLDRYYRAAKEFGADLIVRITADCPMIDPEIIDKAIAMFQRGGFDYVSTADPTPTFPDGLDVSVTSMPVLERVWKEARLKSEREHVFPYVYNHPELFRLGPVINPVDLSQMRWTVDEPADLEFVRRVYASLGARVFGMQDVLDLLERDPGLLGVNAGIIRNEGYLKSLRQDKEAAMSKGKGQELYKRAKEIIPGGTQLLSKRPEMFLPDHWPSYYSKAKGAEVWDLDGRKYIDMSYSAIGASILGYADPDVDEAVINAVKNGNVSTLNCPEEVELAEVLLAGHPWAGKVRYARTGGEGMAIAVRIARAHSGRDKVAFCGYHGWHDWYLAANLSEDDKLNGHLIPGLEPKGVPRGLLGTAVPFSYNNIQELEKIVAESVNGLGAIVMEPLRNFLPQDGFLEKVRAIATRINTPLIFDEVTTGFRLTDGGAHLMLGVQPDIAVFGKAISNGYPMAAVIGTEKVMQAVQTTFISSTYWTDRIGPTASLATIRKASRLGVTRRLETLGQKVQQGWKEIAAANGLKVEVGGMPQISHFSFLYDEGQAMKTLFVKLMLEKGYLATNAYYAMYAHTDEMVAKYLEAADATFRAIAMAQREGVVEKMIGGPVAHTGFRRLT